MECQRFHAIHFENIRPLYFIDLTTQNLFHKKELFDGLLPDPASPPDVQEIIEALGIYQLILASHTKVSYEALYKGETYYFKAEYIIPQLLLQWVKMQGVVVDGLRYESCTSSSKFPKRKDHYNYVLPVKSNEARGYCPSLTALFRISPVYSCMSEKRSNTITVLKQITSALLKVPLKVLADLPKKAPKKKSKP